MTGHHDNRRPTTGPTAPPPGWRDATLNRPARFVARPEPVRAVWHDGSDAQLALVTDWVQQVTNDRELGDREMRVEVEPGPVLVIRSSVEPVRLEPGMALVLRAAGWTVCRADQFLAKFEPLPRELPIFDDGEVA